MSVLHELLLASRVRVVSEDTRHCAGLAEDLVATFFNKGIQKLVPHYDQVLISMMTACRSSLM